MNMHGSLTDYYLAEYPLLLEYSDVNVRLTFSIKAIGC